MGQYNPEAKRAYERAVLATERGREMKRARDNRYRVSEKGRKTRREADARYRKSAKGAENKKDNNDRRSYVGEMYLGMFGFSPRELEEMKANGKID